MWAPLRCQYHFSATAAERNFPHAQRRQKTARTRHPAHSQFIRPPNLVGVGQPGPQCRHAPDQPSPRTPAKRLTARSSHARRLPTTGRPCASPSPSLRSTSALAGAALSPPPAFPGPSHSAAVCHERPPPGSTGPRLACPHGGLRDPKSPGRRRTAPLLTQYWHKKKTE